MSLWLKKRFFDQRCGWNFFPRKCPVAVELNLKHRKLTNVVEQTRNVSTWSDRHKIHIDFKSIVQFSSVHPLVYTCTLTDFVTRTFPVR